MKGYDSELFRVPKEPFKNPTILTQYYTDWHPPARISVACARASVKVIYAIPEKFSHCLGASEYIIRESEYRSPDGEFSLYSPIDLGLIRNTNPRSIFNLVMEGKLEMETPTMHSPLTFVIKNLASFALSFFLPAGSI
jgi:hypothetical protein